MTPEEMAMEIEKLKAKLYVASTAYTLIRNWSLKLAETCKAETYRVSASDDLMKKALAGVD